MCNVNYVHKEIIIILRKSKKFLIILSLLENTILFKSTQH